MKANFLSRKTHRWIALLVGIQAVFWMVSGAYMATIDIDFIHGDPLVKNVNKPLPEDISGLYPMSAVLDRYPQSKAINMVSRLGIRIMWSIQKQEKHYLMRATVS